MQEAAGAKMAAVAKETEAVQRPGPKVDTDASAFNLRPLSCSPATCNATNKPPHKFKQMIVFTLGRIFLPFSS